jgi:hypothetical protein
LPVDFSIPGGELGNNNNNGHFHGLQVWNR